MAKREYRMPESRTPEEIMALTTMSDEEKEQAIINLKKIALSDGWLMLGNDPELQAFWAMTERELTALLHPEFQGRPFDNMNLILLEVARYNESDYQYGLISQQTAQEIEQYKDHKDVIEDVEIAYAKLANVAFPDAEFWNEEERTMLKFVRATLENKMTDELWKKAIDFWGNQKTLRYVMWIAFCQTWVYLIESFGMYYDPVEMNLPNGGMAPELIDTITEKFVPVRKGVLDLWNSLNDFGK